MKERHINLRPILYLIESELVKNFSCDPLSTKAYIGGLFRVFSKFRILLNAKALDEINLIEGILAPLMEGLSEKEVKTLKREIEQLIALNPGVSEKQFIFIFFETLKDIQKILNRGQRGMTDGYFLYGIVLGLDIFHYCHAIDIFRSLVREIQVYANSWPATFALPAIKEDLELLLKEYKVLEQYQEVNRLLA